MQSQLKQLGEEISDKFTITKVLMSLPDENKHFISAWESAPDNKQTIVNLVARLLVEEERLKEKIEKNQETSSSSAFVAKRSVKCFKCGKPGHYQSECRNNKDSEKNVNFNKCFYCGKPGHIKAQCRFRKSKHSKKMSNAFFVSNSEDERYEKSKRLVDSGASEHMCCDRSLLSSFSSVSQKSVIVGNGAIISVLGSGKMVVQVYNGSEWVDTTIDNVLFVPELKTNLFSVNRAADRGYVMMTDNNTCRFYKNNIVCAVANRLDNSYYMEFRFKILKDDYSNFRTVYLVKTKDEIKHCLEDFLNRAENVTGNKVKTFRTGNGMEFINKEVKEMCSERGIIHQTTVCYTPEQNGKAERENRTLVEAARTMLHANNLHKKLWAEAVNTAAFVLNRTGKGRDGKSPFELWTGRSYNIHQLQEFGSPVYAYIPKEKRRKFDKKAEKGLMVGYGEETKGYRIYFSEKNCIFIKRDVVFLNKFRL
ncbi:Retrovirus-related Pol polyprotein from transposon TNT 1-94 [Eumeta japonica]|uniref:Retrovirus-related Pol polyprotein from transposon TNT 1-94 n=1 Tax=Eumeta variegata TaxID=151549 RepID=A0A4C1XCI5_EUMVA|nr:Retrovirus-related Pol polyprotein from transposon TNT 1-94 [Eumeta japonica]